MKRTLLLLAALFAMSLPLAAQDFVADPASLPGGLSYPQWSAKWWQWFLSIPFPIHPFWDTTGAYCDVDQSGPVWFLAGGSATRTCTVPARKMILFPLYNLENDYPCPDPNFHPGPGQSLEQFLTIGYGDIWGARQYVDHITALSASLDGIPVKDLTLPSEHPKYRATSPLFVFHGDRSLRVPLDPCIGPLRMAVSDGYWIMLKPLPPGSHTLIFSSTWTDPSGSYPGTTTYNLWIQ
jgi:hypothetical protein